jgi:hypothetical protein
MRAARGGPGWAFAGRDPAWWRYARRAARVVPAEWITTTRDNPGQAFAERNPAWRHSARKGALIAPAGWAGA